MVYEFFLDDSGTTDAEPVVTLAGFYGPRAIWTKLETEWDELFKIYDIDIFHSKDFHSRKGIFNDWNEERKLEIIEKIFVLAKDQIFGLCSGFHKSTFGFSKSFFKEEMNHTSPLSLALSENLLNCFGEIERYPDFEFFQIYIEAGNKNSGGMRNFVEGLRRHIVFKNKLLPVIFISKSDRRAIQIADIIAFFVRRKFTRYSNLYHNKLTIEEINNMRHCRILTIIKKYVHVFERCNLGPTGLYDIDLKKVEKFSDLQTFKSL